MKRPMLMVALIYIAGLLCARLIDCSLPILYGLFAAGLLTALVHLAWPKARSFLLAPLLFLLGLINYTQSTALVSPRDLRAQVDPRGMVVQVRGRLIASPRLHMTEKDAGPSWRSSTKIRVESLRQDGFDWRPVLGTVLIQTPGLLPDEFFAGQPVVIDGLMRAPSPPLLRTLFDYPAFLRNQGIHFELVTESIQAWQLAAPPDIPAARPPLPLRFAAWARQTLARGLPDAENDEAVRLLWAMSLGWRTALNGEVSEPFMRSGTLHIFAISGLHVTLLSGLLVGCLRLFRLSRGACGLTAIPLLWFYTAVTGWQASAVRSSVMMTVILAGWALRRPSDLLNSLCAAALLILIADPLQLFQAGFQLSFAVVLSLALLLPLLEPARQKLLQPDPFLPATLRPRWKQWLDSPARYLSHGLATSLVAWLGSLPLVMTYFHYLTPVSLVSNLAIIPLSGLALTSCLGSLLAGAWLPALAECFNHSAWLWMNLMIRVSVWTSEWPGAWFHTASLSPAALVLYYALLAGWMTTVWRRPAIRRWFFGGLAIPLAILVWQWRSNLDIARLTILPLEGGTAVYCEFPDAAQRLLIDTGNEASARRATLPFLKSKGVNRLPSLLLTHGDIRHVGGAAQVTALYPGTKILAGPTSFRSSVYRGLLRQFELDKRLRTLQAGDDWNGWSVLHPAPEDDFPLADDRALVLFREIQGTRVLLCSDLGPKGQDAILRRFPDLRADLVISGLPVKSEPLLEGFLETIRPRIILITDADRPPVERANPRLRQRLTNRDARVLFTSDCGGVELIFSEAGCEVVRSKDENETLGRSMPIRQGNRLGEAKKPNEAGEGVGQ